MISSSSTNFTQVGSGSGCTTSATFTTQDQSGFTVSITGTTINSIYFKNGMSIQSGSITDTHGNKINTKTGCTGASCTWTDSLGIDTFTESYASGMQGASGPTTASGLWTNPSYIETNDSNYATKVISANSNSTDIKAEGFGFSIPTGATIAGITVNVIHGDISGNGSTSDHDITLLKAGSAVGSNKAQSMVWGSGPETYTYGSTSDLWGTTWSPSDINSSTFGVQVSAHNGDNVSATAGITYISIAVTYASPQATYTWTDVNGGSPQVTSALSSLPLTTIFGCSGKVDYNGTTAISEPSTITFADGRSLGLSYELTATGSSFYTGRIAGLTFPEGGSVSFTYSGGSHGIDCMYQTPPVLTRTLSNGDVSAPG